MILGAVAPHHLAATPTPDVSFPSISSSAHKHAHSQSHLYGLEQDDAALLMDADEVGGLREGVNGVGGIQEGADEVGRMGGGG